MKRIDEKTTGDESEEVVDNQTKKEYRAPSSGRESSDITDSTSSEDSESDEVDTTTIDKGPYGAVAILTVDEPFLRSLGFDPEHVDELRYQPYNGAVLVEPVTQ